QRLQECAVPLEGDRRVSGALRRDRDSMGPIPLQRGAAIEPGGAAQLVRAARAPAGAAQLVIAGFEPGEPDEQPDRQPEQAGSGVAEQEPGEGRLLDLARLATRLRA